MIKPIVERIGKVVTRVKVKFPEVNYQYGHPKEIIETLDSWSGSATLDVKKYPLIGLFQDFPETVTDLGKVVLHLIIATRTESTWKAEQRYAETFKPILYPIYEEFIKQLGREFPGNYVIDHTKIDRLYWGRNGLPLDSNDKNRFNDWIDCIEIQNLNLPILSTQNC